MTFVSSISAKQRPAPSFLLSVSPFWGLLHNEGLHLASLEVNQTIERAALCPKD